MYVKQLSVFLQNKPGHLAQITEILKDGGVSIRAINVSEGNEFGILRVIVDDAYKSAYLLKDQGYLCRLSDVLAVEPEDRVGAMAEIFAVLGAADISINYIYSIIRPLHDQMPVIILSTSDQARAAQVIQDLGVSFITNREMSAPDAVVEIDICE